MTTKDEPWTQLEGESDAWYGHFVTYLSIGHGRTLSRAYRLAHPDSEASEVSAAWRQEFRDRRWRQRATSSDLHCFRQDAREATVLMGRSMRAFARKTLRAMLSKEAAMRPATWEECSGAFEALWRMFPPQTIHAIATQGDEPDGKGVPRHRPEDFDENGDLKELPEMDVPAHGGGDPWQRFEVRPGETAKEFHARTGFYPPEGYVDPAPPAPPG